MAQPNHKIQLTVESQRPNELVRPYVRAYAQRVTTGLGNAIIEAVPARLETVLQFEFGAEFTVEFEDGTRPTSPRIALVGPQTHCRATLHLPGALESFAVFFQPAGFVRLFAIPICLLKNRAYDASLVEHRIRQPWQRLGELQTFSGRVAYANEYFSSLAQSQPPRPLDVVTIALDAILQRRGMMSIACLTSFLDISPRHFERLFSKQVAMTPKSYMRVARFQTALDAKVKNPHRTWSDIAHSLLYSDQMHMIHDFKRLAGGAPESVFRQLGDIRPDALTDD